jgi:hypothetical protein
MCFAIVDPPTTATSEIISKLQLSMDEPLLLGNQGMLRGFG